MGIALVVVLVVGGFGILTYNGLTSLRAMANGAWADIDVQLKRRHDLVPALVAAVKGHAGYERGTLEAVVEARNRAASASGPKAAGQAEGTLADSVGQLLALAEAYPDLKGAESFLSLQKNLTDIENQVQQARRYYNAVVRDLNTKIQQFPANLVAGPLGFAEREYFGIEGNERDAPTMDLGRNG